MIMITRRYARRLRGLFRRSVLGIGHRGHIPPLVFRAEETRLRVRHRYKSLAVEHAEPGFYAAQEIALPLDALGDFEGRDESPVILEAVTHDQTTVRWTDRGIPQTREYTVPAIGVLAPFPEMPEKWSTSPPEFLKALADASATTCEDSKRYALTHIQLKGDSRQIGATDGHQLLLQGGFRLPWKDSVLVPRSPIYGCRDLPHDQPITLGRTDTFVALQVGPWTLLLEIYAEGRFPVLGDVVPSIHAITTRLRVDPEDAEFLASALDRLPGTDELNSPATVDLNGRIAIRTRGPDPPQATELVLSRSAYTGTPVRVNSNREFLTRAIRLGFRELEIADAKSPLVCRDRHKVYVWQPLSPDCALEPGDDVIRIESVTTSPDPDPAPGSSTHSEGEIDVNRKTTTDNPSPSRAEEPMNGHSAPNEAAASNGPTAPDPANPGSLAALIQEAESLVEAVADLRGRAQRLLVGLRRHRKQARLMSSTLAALKQLKLQEVGE